MNVSRRELLTALGMSAAALAVPSAFADLCTCSKKAKIAVQLYSIGSYVSRVGLERALETLASIGFKGVEFYGGSCFGQPAKSVRKWLADNGLKGCGIHVDNGAFGFNTTNWTYDAETLKRTCAFNLEYGNNLIICPGGGNCPPGVSWSTGQGGKPCNPSPEIDEFTKKLIDLYNRASTDAAREGCLIGIHNHTWEHGVIMQNGQTYWDYFFSNTSDRVCMEQDVGWTTCAGVDPKEQYVKYPHRAPTLHAKENGMGSGVREFDAILGKPGKPGAKPVDWDGLIPVTEADGVEWYVVECERHFEDLSAVLPSYRFLKSKGLR